MKKVYNHAVIYNGIFYPANTPIEVEDKKAETAEKSSVVEKPTKKGGVKNDKGTH